MKAMDSGFALAASIRTSWIIVWIAVLAQVGPLYARQEPDSGSTTGAASAPPAPADPVDFARDVFPILRSHCLKCHGPEKQEAELRVDQSESVLHEDFVVPGDGENSRLYEVLISEDDDRMPPAEEDHVVPAQDAEMIKTWIDQGAKWGDISALLVSNQTETKQAADAAKSVTVGDPMPLTPRAAYWMEFWRAVGDFHPAVVHFPIALLIVGGLFALFGLRGSYRCSDFAFYCLWLGALTALIASAVGWSFAWNEGHNEDPFKFETQARLFWHRWSGIALSIAAFLLAVWATVARRRDPENGTFWKVCMILLAALTIYVGHAGGELTHRRGYSKLYELMGWQAPADSGPPKAFEAKESESESEKSS